MLLRHRAIRRYIIILRQVNLSLLGELKISNNRQIY